MNMKDETTITIMQHDGIVTGTCVILGPDNNIEYAGPILGAPSPANKKVCLNSRDVGMLRKVLEAAKAIASRPQ